jgi:hypothetical protein
MKVLDLLRYLGEFAAISAVLSFMLVTRYTVAPAISNAHYSAHPSHERTKAIAS